ncbi:methyltransferase domain-containing protein [Nostoc sp. UHCC 0251]|uniref:methyltransferase domain-containing protein n=1 Tax=Nostoc sp. UHCC 0251 TaxID=3110240 RepID=UPI002B1F9A4E|nr:methyltransferase domain-containing protein [Nostoc sp. UHCC 0251]MEA5626227.1 methyltransferase domain-containing protein [Nostoc sp. UHCC 0251]
MENRNLKKYYEDYLSLPFEEIQISYRRKKILEYLVTYKAQKICEIGCGLDPLFNYISSFEAIHIVEPIFEFYENAYGMAKSKSNITVHLGKLEENIPSLSKENFDYIVMSSLLHEVENPEDLLISLNQISSANTVIHINVPNAKSFHRILAYEMGLINNIFEKSAIQNKMQQFKTFDLESLKSLVISHGFSVIESGSYFVKPFTHEQMQKMYAQNILTKEILNGLYLMVKYMPEMGSEIFVNVKANK